MDEPVSAYVHYYNRGVNKEKIFFVEENYAYLIGLISKYQRYYQIELVAYCLMPNHYHILLKHEKALEGSRFIQRTFNSYSQAINKQQNRVGTLFQGNVKKRYIDSEEYLADCITYIHLNPVRSGLCNHPGKWKYSDYHEWADIQRSRREVNGLCKEIFGDFENYKEMIEIELANLR